MSASSIATAEARALHEALGLSEEPYGIRYADQAPAGGLAPEPGPALSIEGERAGTIPWAEVWEKFSCVMGKLWLARKKNTAAVFEAARYGCPGGSFYLGFHAPQLDFITCYVSTGIPGTPVAGERYLPSPAAARRFFTDIPPRPAPARYCVMEPLSRCPADAPPELVTFFARGEVLTGLANLAAFVTDDLEMARLVPDRRDLGAGAPEDRPQPQGLGRDVSRPPDRPAGGCGSLQPHGTRNHRSGKNLRPDGAPPIAFSYANA